MTFARFEELVKEKHPEAELFKHGEFAGNKINVAIIFNPNGKVYKYNGTYCEVLNRLGVKAIYKHDLENVKNTLKLYIKSNGKEDGFGFGIVYDYTDRIKEMQEQIANYETNYVIV